jgi:hypothetical protein
MTEPAPRTTVSAVGTVNVQHRPSLLLMKIPLRASVATVELGLASLRKQVEETTQRLKRLGAAKIAAGMPHLADLGPKDAVLAATQRFQRQRSRPGASNRRPDVDQILTATWEIDALSAEETVLLVDQLRFESGDEASPSEPEETPSWADPEEQARQMLAQMQLPPVVDRSPKLFFISRLPDAEAEKACARAFELGRRHAARTARAAGMRLGRLSSLHQMGGIQATTPHQLVDRQRCMGLLAGCNYDLDESEVVSDSPCPASFSVSLSVQYELEPT